jgi:hypothetical protein
MKAFLALALTSLALVACAPTETDSLRNENTQLKQDLAAVTKQRDEYKARLDAVRAALDGAVPASGSSADAPATTDPNAVPGLPPSSPTPPEPAPAPADPNAPSSPNAAPAPTPPAVPQPSSETVTRLRTYADNVLSAAQNYNAQNKSAPPIDCVKGYAAGDYKVEALPDTLQECVVTIAGDGTFGVRLRDGSGNAVSVP